MQTTKIKKNEFPKTIIQFSTSGQLNPGVHLVGKIDHRKIISKIFGDNVKVDIALQYISLMIFAEVDTRLKSYIIKKFKYF